MINKQNKEFESTPPK